MMDNNKLWGRYQKYLWYSELLGMSLDISRVNFEENIFEIHENLMNKAFNEMQKLEAGARHRAA